jgi:O-antigen/teichoic acid export membrane protein
VRGHGAGAPGEGADEFLRGVVPGGGRRARAGVEILASRFAQVVIGLGTIAALGRLLAPEDFGLFAMAALLLTFVSTFKDFGLPMAVVQSPVLHQRQVSGLFWLNCKLSLALASIVAATAPLLAWFFGEPGIVAGVLTLALALGFSGVGTVHQGLLARGMRFGRVAVTDTAAAAGGAVVGVGMALLGAGYWALVGQQAAVLVLMGALPWLLCGWRPSTPARSERLGLGSAGPVRFGRDHTITKVLTRAARNVDLVLIGRFLGAGPLGLYQVAFRAATIPLQQIYQPLGRVVVASASRFPDDPDGYGASYRSGVRSSAALVLPMLALMLVRADDLVLFLLGDQWGAAVPVFRALVVATALDVARVSVHWAFLTEGRTAQLLRWTFFTTPLTVVALVIGLRWGIVGVGVGYAAAIGLALVPLLLYCAEGSSLRVRDLALPVLRPAIAASGAAAALHLARFHPLGDATVLLRLLQDGAFFTLLYLVAWLALPGGPRTLAGPLDAVRRLLSGGPYASGSESASETRHPTDAPGGDDAVGPAARLGQ